MHKGQTISVLTRDQNPPMEYVSDALTEKLFGF